MKKILKKQQKQLKKPAEGKKYKSEKKIVRTLLSGLNYLIPSG